MPTVMQVITMEDGSEVEITDLDHLVSMVSGTGNSEYIGSEKGISLRVPAILVAKIDAMAANSKVSRNTLCCDLLEFAVSEVYSQLNASTSQKILEETNKLVSVLCNEGAE